MYHDDNAWRGQEHTDISASAAKEPGRDEAPDIGPSWRNQ